MTSTTTAPGVNDLDPAMKVRFVEWLGVHMAPADLLRLGLFVVEKRPGRQYAELVPGPMHPDSLSKPPPQSYFSPRWR